MTAVDERARPDASEHEAATPVVSRASVLAAGSGTAATATTIGMQFGPAGLVAAGVVTAGLAVAAAVARRVAPGTAERLGLRRPSAAARSAGARTGSGRRAGGARRAGAAANRRGARAGLLGGAGRKAAAAARRKAGTAQQGGRRGLVGSARRPAGRPSRTASGSGRSGAAAKKRSAVGAARTGAARSRKGTGLLGGRAKTGGRSRTGGSGKRTGGLLGGRKSPARGAGAGKRPGGKPGTRGGLLRGLLGGDRTDHRRDSTPGLEEFYVRGRGPTWERAATTMRAGTDGGTTPETTMNRENARTARAGGTGSTAVGTSGGATMPNPFDSHNEAVATAANSLEIENARALIDWVNNAPDAAAAQASMWSGHATKIAEQIKVAPVFADALSDFANAQTQMVERIREAGDVFTRAHTDDLRRINEPLPGEDKWDISKNQP